MHCIPIENEGTGKKNNYRQTRNQYRGPSINALSAEFMNYLIRFVVKEVKDWVDQFHSVTSIDLSTFPSSVDIEYRSSYIMIMFILCILNYSFFFKLNSLRFKQFIEYLRI